MGPQSLARLRLFFIPEGSTENSHAFQRVISLLSWPAGGRSGDNLTLPPAVINIQSVRATSPYGPSVLIILTPPLRSLSGYHLTFYESPLRVK